MKIGRTSESRASYPPARAPVKESLAATLQSYIEGLIAERTATASRAVTHKLSVEEFEASLDELTRYSDKIPVLRSEAFSRENLYEDHD